MEATPKKKAQKEPKGLWGHKKKWFHALMEGRLNYLAWMASIISGANCSLFGQYQFYGKAWWQPHGQSGSSAANGKLVSNEGKTDGSTCRIPWKIIFSWVLSTSSSGHRFIFQRGNALKRTAKAIQHWLQYMNIPWHMGWTSNGPAGAQT